MVQEILNEFKTDITFSSEYLFCAIWQHEQLEKARTAFPFSSNTITAVLNFAQNYIHACFSMTAVLDCTKLHTLVSRRSQSCQSWNHKQVTLIPVVAYYQCRDSCHEEVDNNIPSIPSTTKRVEEKGTSLQCKSN